MLPKSPPSKPAPSLSPPDPDGAIRDPAWEALWAWLLGPPPDESSLPDDPQPDDQAAESAPGKEAA